MYLEEILIRSVTERVDFLKALTAKLENTTIFSNTLIRFASLCTHLCVWKQTSVGVGTDNQCVCMRRSVCVCVQTTHISNGHKPVE